MQRKAFTFLELVVVIVIFGIVAMIGSDVFMRIYENYLTSRVMNTLETKTEITLEQIAKRLQYRIKESTIARDQNNLSNYLFLGDADGSYEILEWIGYDNDSYLGTWNGTFMAPGWSGFADIDPGQSDKTRISTPGSRLSEAAKIIWALSNGQVDLNSTAFSEPAVIFAGYVGDYNVSSFGWYPFADSNYSHPVYRNGTDGNLTFTNTASKELYERYRLSWTAYAIVPTGTADDFNLTLYWNYRPWEGEQYSDGTSALLCDNVRTFKFFQEGDTVRLKLCVSNKLFENNISVCKEKVIF